MSAYMVHPHACTICHQIRNADHASIESANRFAIFHTAVLLGFVLRQAPDGDLVPLCASHAGLIADYERAAPFVYVDRAGIPS